MVKKVLDDAPAQEAGAAEDRHLSDICHLLTMMRPAHRSVRPLKTFSGLFCGRSMAIERKELASQINEIQAMLQSYGIWLWLLDSAG